MSLLQLARCCDCSMPYIPCADCGTNKCTCQEPPGASGTVPITSVHIEVGNASTRSFRAQSTKDSRAWHYMNNLRWRATEYGPRSGAGRYDGRPAVSENPVNRLVLNAQSWMNGFRYGDKMYRISDKIMTLVLPAGQWGKTPKQGLNSHRVRCGCDPLPVPCNDGVMCCYCDIPGYPHNGGCVDPYVCSQEGGTNIGNCSDKTPDDCYQICEQYRAGASVSRMGRLIPDPLRKGVEKIATKFRNGKLGLHWKYLLRQNAVETATNPEIRPDGDYDNISKSEQQQFDYNEMLPITSEPDGLTPRYRRIAQGNQRGNDPSGDDSPRSGNFLENVGDCGDCIGNQCTRSGPYFDLYFNAFDQRKDGVWNYVAHSGDCCNAGYSGASYTVEMDWPCEETANAYIKAKQKYDFGKAAFEEARRYCTNEGVGTLECGGGGQIDQPWLCHPLAEELIGAEPPNLVPCIKTCPLQTGMGACRPGFVRWPQGDYVPDGENVLQNIPCLGGADVVDPNDGDELPDEVRPVQVIPTGEAGCSFKTKPVARNYSSLAYCDEHQCGAALCGAQYCCEVEDCFENDCCEQLLFNPQTGEVAQYDDDGCVVDEDGRKIGGWRTYPDPDGSYFRCPKQEDRVIGINKFGDEYTVCPGCTETRGIEQTCAECGPANSQQYSCRSSGNQCNPRGDVTNWTIPRKKNFGGQGTYSRHCPDHLEPFTLRDRNRFGNRNCARDVVPSIGDPDFCWYDERNPQGTFCSGGFCTHYNSQVGAFGEPYHRWPREKKEFSCVPGYVDDKYPCEKGWVGCPDDYEGLPDVLDDQGSGPVRPDNPNGPGNGGDDPCDNLCPEDGLLLYGHHPSACGQTPCDDHSVFVHKETGEVFDPTENPTEQGPPDNSGDWIRAGCYRCGVDGIGRKTRAGLGCVADPCGGVNGYNSNLVAFGDGYYEDEMGLQLISVSCSPQKHRTYPIDNLGRQDGCTGQFRQKWASEQHFQVYLEYKGGGCGYSGFSRPRKAITRQGQGRLTLVKDEDAPATCVFGTYKHPIGSGDGWYTAGGANPAPYWQNPNPGSSFYYKHMLAFDEEGRPDCNREYWKRPYNLFGCKMTIPKVVIL